MRIIYVCTCFCLFSFQSIAQKILNITDFVLSTLQGEILAKRKLELTEQINSYKVKKNVFENKCTGVEEKTPLDAACKTEQKEIENIRDLLVEAINEFNSDILSGSAKYVQHIKKSMVDLARKFKWTEMEITRLDTALNKIAGDGDSTVTSSQVVSSWAAIHQRGEDPKLKIKANGGKGPGLPGAGKQSTYDCAVFALANASGRPYSEVAGIAIELIKKGEWRSEEDKKDPHKVFKNGGLMGSEVLMLAEALGQVEVIKSSAFEKTLSSGRTIMTNVVPDNGNFNSGHEVVLTKTFKQNGETWFEMIDSNREGPWQRLYLNSKELQTILQENGVVYRPEKGTVPKLLR